MNNYQTKKIQLEILKVYKEVKRVCDKNNIRYFALGGTLLGAVRHKGFIPWDDDMDLGIPIDDFEKFKKACKKDLKDPFEFKELIWIGGKVHNKNTTFLETTCVAHKESSYGVFVDIFPLIGTPNDPEKRKAFLKDMFRYQFQAMLFDRYPESSSFSKQKILEWRNKILYQNKLSGSERIAEFSFGHNYSTDAKGIINPMIVEFEDTTIPIPSTYDEDLTSHYGDYMKLPPKEQRATHNEYALVDLGRPCEYYYKKIQKIDPVILDLFKQKHKLEGSFFINAASFAADVGDLLDENRKLRQQIENYNRPLYKRAGSRIKRKIKALLGSKK